MLEVLGVCIDLGFVLVVCSFVEVGIGFCFVLWFYFFYWYVVVVCCEIGVFIVFNFFGLLINLVWFWVGLIGCVFVDFVEVMVGVFVVCWFSVLVVYGDDGLDELIIIIMSMIWCVVVGSVDKLMFDFVGFGFVCVQFDQLVGGDV